VYDNSFSIISGNIMTLSYNIGLTGGSLVAYLLDAILGPASPDICKMGRPSLIGPIPGTNIPQIESTVAVVTPLLMNLSSVMPTEAGYSTVLDQLVGPVNATTAATILLGLTTSTASLEQLTPAAAAVFNVTASTGSVLFNTTVTT
jgi:hypothetical protein